jgi:hypothetical protein
LFADSFSKFRDVFYSTDRNGLQSFIFNNDLIKRGIDDAGTLDLQFFRSCGVPVNEFLIARLTVKDFFSADMANFKSMNELRDSTGIDFNLLLYIRLRHSLTYFVSTLRSGNPNKSVSLAAFFRPARGEARRIRKIMDNSCFNKKLENQPSVKTFFRLCGINLTQDLILGRIFGFWNNSFLTNRHREFCFKFFNNQLPINTRVSHFVDNHGRLCSNCTTNNVRPCLEETFLHLFFDCVCTKQVHQWFLSHYCGIVNADPTIRKKFFMTGILTGTETAHNIFGLFCALTIQFLIWEAKTRKKIISINWINSEFTFATRSILKISGKFRADFHLFVRGNTQNWDHIYLPARG